MAAHLDDRHENLTTLAERVREQTDVLDRLSALQRLAAAVTVESRRAVADARSSRYSWNDIGGRLGVSKQAAAQRFGAEQVKRQPHRNDEHPQEREVRGRRSAREPVSGWVVTSGRGRALFRIGREQ